MHALQPPKAKLSKAEKEKLKQEEAERKAREEGECMLVVAAGLILFSLWCVRVVLVLAVLMCRRKWIHVYKWGAQMSLVT